MEELTPLGHKRKNILVKFLKENKIYGYFLANTLCARMKHNTYRSINEIFNDDNIEEMCLNDFFSIYSASYPRKMKAFDKFVYWSNWGNEWRKYICFQKYKKYDIW
jgi:hypothetical protein